MGAPAKAREQPLHRFQRLPRAAGDLVWRLNPRGISMDALERLPHFSRSGGFGPYRRQRRRHQRDALGRREEVHQKLVDGWRPIRPSLPGRNVESSITRNVVRLARLAADPTLVPKGGSCRGLFGGGVARRSDSLERFQRANAAIEAKLDFFAAFKSGIGRPSRPVARKLTGTGSFGGWRLTTDRLEGCPTAFGSVTARTNDAAKTRRRGCRRQA